MNYCIVDDNNIISNIIVCDDDATAKKMGAISGYDGATIGTKYDPYNYYAVAELKQKLNEQQTLLNEQEELIGVLTGTSTTTIE